MSNLPPKPCTSSFRHWNYASTLSILAKRECSQSTITTKHSMTIFVHHHWCGPFHYKHFKFPFEKHAPAQRSYQTLKFHHYYYPPFIINLLVFSTATDSLIAVHTVSPFTFIRVDPPDFSLLVRIWASFSGVSLTPRSTHLGSVAGPNFTTKRVSLCPLLFTASRLG